jgi:hypothetical protein
MEPQRKLDSFEMHATFQSLWVRKLIGQARGLYTPGLRVRGSPHPATERRAFLTHSDVDSPARLIASAMVRFSSGESLAWMRIARFLDFGTFGLPIFGFIKTLRMTKITVDGIYFLSYV